MSSDQMSYSFTINQIPRHVWEKSHTVLVPGKICHIPVLPNYTDNYGSEGRIIKIDPERLLIVTKATHPFIGSEISIRLEPFNASGWPTQVTLTQLQSDSHTDSPDTSDYSLWKEFVVNYHLYLERNVICPPYNPPVTLGMSFDETSIGLVVTKVDRNTVAEKCDIQSEDLLITIQGIRILRIDQLLSVTSMLTLENSLEIKFARGNEILTRNTSLA